MLVTLSKLSPVVAKNASSSEKSSKMDKKTERKADVAEEVVFSQ